MITALITTDPVFGPWNIPSRGQNMIMSYYAHLKTLQVDTIIPEPLFSKSFSTTRWVKKNKGLDRILLCSIHQLDVDEEYEIIRELSDLEFHFCLEDLSGKGESFLLQVFKELKFFKNTKMISYNSVTTYQALQNMLLDSRA